MDQLAEDAIVGGVTIRRVEAADTGATESAEAVLIQREGVLERRAATYAEKFGIERLYRCETRAAHRIPENFRKRFFADPAVIREEEGKKGVRS
jgi:hypothetical protein